jgi:hypothetical protein
LSTEFDTFWISDIEAFIAAKWTTFGTTIVCANSKSDFASHKRAFFESFFSAFFTAELFSKSKSVGKSQCATISAAFCSTHGVSYNSTLFEAYSIPKLCSFECAHQ